MDIATLNILIRALTSPWGLHYTAKLASTRHVESVGMCAGFHTGLFGRGGGCLVPENTFNFHLLIIPSMKFPKVLSLGKRRRKVYLIGKGCRKD